MTKNYRLLRDLVAVRELPAAPDSAVIIQLDNPNKRPNTTLTGIVEQIGPQEPAAAIALFAVLPVRQRPPF